MRFTEVQGKGWIAEFPPLHAVASGGTQEEAALNLAEAIDALRDTLDPTSDEALVAISELRILKGVYGGDS